jgi:hypothetical protein
MLGKKDRFGIEISLHPRYDRFIIADLCLWANNLRIGDDISGVDVPLILEQLSGPLYMRERSHVDFFFQAQQGRGCAVLSRLDLWRQ